MANGLPTPQSQARVISPTPDGSHIPTLGQQLIGALPDIANIAFRANEVSAKKEAAAQSAQDQADVSSFITERNDLEIKRNEFLIMQEDLLTAQDDIDAMHADGVITDAEATQIRTFNTQLEKLKSTEAQGFLNPVQFENKSRILLNQHIAKNQRISQELNSIFNKATGGGSDPVSGAAVAQQLQLNQRMNSKYRGNWTLEDLKKESIQQQQVLEADRNKLLGSISVDNMASSSGIKTSNAIEGVMTHVGLTVSDQGLLDNKQETAALEALRKRKAKIISDLQKDVFTAQKEGRIIDDSEVRAIIGDIEKDFDAAKAYIIDKGLQPQLKKRNEVSAELWKARMGHKISRYERVSATMGPGGMNALHAMLVSSSSKDKDAILSLSDSSVEGFDLANFKSDLVDAMTRIAQDERVPGFEKLDTYIGLKAMKSGDVGEPVKQNSLANMSTMTNNAGDAADVLKALNDPKVSRQYAKGDSTTKASLVNTVNNNETWIFGEIESGGYSVRLVDESQEVIRDARARSSRTVIRPTKLEVFKITKRRTTGRGIGGGDVVEVNASLTNQLNTAMEIHKNPNYSSVLQPQLPWIKEVIEKFSEQPQVEESAVQP